jgi:hypothetical protein
MDSNRQVQTLQTVYAAALADMVVQLQRENILEKVTERKRQEQMLTGKMRAGQFGVTQPEEVFTKLAELFACANWVITKNLDGSFTAQSTVCKLCAFAKKMGAAAPCQLYCLDPMEGMVKALKPDSVYAVEETLWNGTKCSIRVG